MNYEWNEAKRVHNRDRHGVDFSAAEAFDWALAIKRQDDRKDYGEMRFVAMAPIGERLHVMVYTLRRDNIRIISLRKASRKEVKRYVEIKSQDAVEDGR